MPASRKTERERLIAANARFDVPLIVMSLFRMLLSLGFIIYTLSAIHSMRVGWIVGFLIFMLMLIALSGRLRKHMRRIESTFFNNLNERELRRSGRNNNLVSDMHLAYIEVGYGCPFVGDRLIDSNLRQRYGVNVASIQRGSSFIAVPNGTMRIFPGDILGIIGTDEQIQALLPIIEQGNETGGENENRADDIKADQHPAVGNITAYRQDIGHFADSRQIQGAAGCNTALRRYLRPPYRQQPVQSRRHTVARRRPQAIRITEIRPCG